MRQACGEWWAVIEGIFRSTLRKLQARLERIYLSPILNDLLLLLCKVKRSGDYSQMDVRRAMSTSPVVDDSRSWGGNDMIVYEQLSSQWPQGYIGWPAASQRE